MSLTPTLTLLCILSSTRAPEQEIPDLRQSSILRLPSTAVDDEAESFLQYAFAKHSVIA
jgi:hypothetical protein